MGGITKIAALWLVTFCEWGESGQLKDALYLNETTSTGPTGKPCTSAVVGFLRSLPKEVVLGWDTIPVKPYIPKPTRCSTVSDTATQPRNAGLRRSAPRAGRPGTSTPPVKQHRSVCGGPHSSSDLECPKWREECRRAKLRYEEIRKEEQKKQENKEIEHKKKHEDEKNKEREKEEDKKQHICEENE
ncbi:hypothetical protein Hamer_G000678 [Homarus americanus]|uniref:Uncharacterized protein n=1 Tax=Homarus americanus TaxID=6706 RepID=A0A8J5TC15_HOMAM|nr:hypothetical protein Hamer_G000678 [Homarus americanus]